VQLETNYKPGGTMTTITGKWQARVTEMGNDARGLGRWSYVKLQSKKNTLMIVTAYRPTVSQGPSTVWMQQWALLRESGERNPDPIATFYLDLEKMLREWKSHGYEIILMMDANETIGDAPSKLTGTLNRLEMTDLVRHKHPNLPEPNTHIRGSSRIDFILGTPKVIANCTKAGIVPFGYGYHSDHRAIFAEININKILSTEVTATDAIQARKLHQATPKEREVFVNHVHRILESQNIYNRLKSLHNECASWTDKEMEQYEICDKIIIESMLKAEQETRRLAVTPWSPRFGEAVAKKSFWKIALSLKINCTRPNEEFIKWAESLGVEDVKGLDIATIKAQLRQAQRQLREVECEANELRMQHLKDMLTRAELEGDEQKVKKRIKILIRAQRQKQYFQRLKKIFKPQNSGGLSYILVPKNFKIEEYPYDTSMVNEWEPVHDHDEMQKLIQLRNIKHFGQAQNTPFTLPPLNQLKWQASTMEAKEIIEGSIPASFVVENPFTNRVINYIAQRQSLPEIDTFISPEQHCRGLRKWRESTSTSPSGCHLGLRRILTYPADDYDIEEARNLILQAQTDIINIPIQAGFSPKRWQKVVNAMLEKIPGKPYLHKLRVIHILEADYNLALKEIFGRRLMWNCEKYGKLGDIQDGFRKGRSTIKTLLHNELVNDYNKRLRRNNFIGLTDISGCFDRIVTPVISLINRKNGCPQAAVAMHASTLEQAKYHLTTKHGTSTSFYQHSKETPIYGNGQGAGDSPSQWCQQSAILFDLYAEMNKGSKMTSSDGKTQASTALAAFADDTNLLGNDDNCSKSVPEIIQEAQTAFTTWNELLHAMGHFMELEKCTCYLSIWAFQEDGYAFTLEPHEINQQIIIVDHEGKEKQISQLSATMSQKLLGVMRNPIGNQQDEIQRLHEKSSKIARSINSHALSRIEAKLAYEAFFIPAMRYSLAVTSINQVDFETIQRKTTSSLLAFLGYNRHMPREVIFGSQKYQGLGLRHLYDIQGTDGIRLLLQEMNNVSSTTCTMLSILLDTIQQEAGIGRPILEDNRPLQYIEWGWIPSIRDFLHHIDAKITNATEGLPIYREHDRLIMDGEYIKKASRKEALLIHRCRMALQVECVSDISTSDGRQIDQAWLDLVSVKPSQSIKRWPRQGDPGPEAWSIWRKFLSQEYTNGVTFELRTPLGKWLIVNTTREHATYYSIAQGTLWKHLPENRWSCHSMISTQRRTCIFDVNGTIYNQKPQDTIPLDIVKEGTRVIITRRPSDLRQAAIQQASTLEAAIAKQRRTNILFHGTKLMVDENHLKHLCSKPFMTDIASDGSHDQERGMITYGWVMAINEEIIAEGSGPAEGHSSLVESFRAEAYGLASAAAFIKEMGCYISSLHEKGKWFFHLDNKSLIKRMESYTDTQSRPAKWEECPDIDITNIAHSNLQGINIQFNHVKSHQKVHSATTSFPSQLHEMADALASQLLRTTRHPKTEVTIPHKHLVIKKMTVTKDMQKKLMEEASRIPLQQYYKDKYNWSSQTFGNIHWELQHKVLSSYDINDQRRILKFVHNWLPTNKRLHREKASNTQRCPLCQYIVEDELHMFQCQHAIQQGVVQQLKERISNEIKLTDEVKAIMVQIISRGIRGGNCVSTSSILPKDLRKGIEAQSQIGWYQVVYGRMAKDFVACLANNDDSGSSKASAEMHGRKIIRAFWDTMLILWKQRNDVVHGITEDSRRAARIQALDQKVRHCYEQKYIMPIDDRQRLFQKTEEEKLREDPRNIATWIRMAERIIRTNRRENKRMTGQKRMMEQYFKWNPPDQRANKSNREQQQHRKNDLKPD
jgi:hypothetical protein